MLTLQVPLFIFQLTSVLIIFGNNHNTALQTCEFSIIRGKTRYILHNLKRKESRTVYFVHLITVVRFLLIAVWAKIILFINTDVKYIRTYK